MIRIGIILTKASSEKKKDELLNRNSTKRPWLKNTPNKYCIYRDNKCCLPGDVSIGMYIRETYQNIRIDFIKVNEITKDRLKQNDMNFLIIYDLLEAFHNMKDKVKYEQIKKALLESKNVYPSPKYQKFVNDKSIYIKHLNKKKVPVIPTFHYYYKSYINQKEQTVEKIINRVKRQGWDQFIAKPIYGQESIGFKKFKKNLNQAKKELKEYLKKILEQEKKPGVLIQKYIEGFDKNNPEIRMYFIGEEYQYSVITTDKFVSLPKEEKGTKDVPKFKELKKFASDVLKKLPKITINKTKVPKLLTRIDIACQKKFSKPWIVNEIEFVPSLYIEDINLIPEPKLGDMMVKITKKLIKLN